MCVHHYFYYGPCGHMVKNLRLSIQHHCPDVDQALRYYHNQPLFLPIEEILCNHYDFPACQELQVPETCPEVWPSPIVCDPKLQAQLDYEYRNWCRETTDALFSHQHDAAAAQKEFDRAAPPRLPFSFALTPFPPAHLDHILGLKTQQSNIKDHVPSNVVVHQVPWGCGRSNSPACLQGHNHPEGPFCPYLAASRLQQPLRDTPELQFFRRLDPLRRPRPSRYPENLSFGYYPNGQLRIILLANDFLAAVHREGILEHPPAQDPPAHSFARPVGSHEHYYYAASGQDPPPALYSTSNNRIGAPGPSSAPRRPNTAPVAAPSNRKRPSAPSILPV